MPSRFAPRVFSFVLSALFFTTAAFATTPTITVTSPANNSKTTSPVNYAATATSSGCAQGISAIRVYSAPSVSAYTIAGGSLNAYINLPPATYNTVVQAWDNCGGVAKVYITITTTSQAQPGGFVYTVNSNYFNTNGGAPVNTVQGFSIVAGNGALAPILQGPVNANEDPLAVTSDKGGYRLYVGDYVSGDVFPYFINRSNGYLTPVPGAPFAVDRSVTAVAVHPSGTLIFSTRDEEASGDGVAVFQLQSNGSLAQAPGSPYDTQIGPQAMVVDPSGKYLYVADGNSYIDAFSINETAATLTPLPGSPFTIPVPSNCSSDGRAAYPRDIIDPVGKYIYTADSSMDSISGFTVSSANGTLTDVAGSPWADNGGCDVPVSCDSCSNNPSSLAIDGSGKFLYAVNAELLDISIYSISPVGTLTYIKDIGNPPGVGCNGVIRADSTGNYLYTDSCGVGAPIGFRGLVGFSINHSTGDLTELPTSPYTYPVQGENTAMQDLTVTP
jgi:6-phosphogluconolactonase (cycloisomerase 2 family)